MGHSITLLLAGAVLTSMVVLTTAPSALAREARDKAWLLGYVRQPVPAAPRAQRYVEHMNAKCEDYCGLDTGFLQNGRGGKLEPGRTQLWALARLSYSHYTKGLKYHQDPAAWEKIRQGLLGVAKNVKPDGTFEFGPRGINHEQAWYVEGSLLAFLWAEEKLSPDEREQIRKALYRAAECLATHPHASFSNQGSVWAAIVALASLYFEKPEWMAAANKHADTYVLGGKGNIFNDGEIGEHHTGYKLGGGPDCNYTYTGLAYIYAYRLWSGRSEADPLLMKAAQWLVGYNTLSGIGTIPGASTRMVYDDPGNYPDCLPFFERLSKTDPFFGRVADLALAKAEKHNNAFGAHLAGQAIWAMLEAGTANPPDRIPDWQLNRTALYGLPDRKAVLYALVSRTYQTGIVLCTGISNDRNWPLRGVQTFACGDEQPILMVGPEKGTPEHSKTLADGLDTSAVNLEKVRDDWDVVLHKGAQVEKWRSELAALAARRKTLWELYAFTPAAMVVVYGGAKGEVKTRWAMNSTFVSEPQLDPAARCVTFRDRKGRLSWLAGQASLSAGSGAKVVEVTAPAPVSAFGFSGESFRFEKYDAQKEELSFADASGRYRLSLAGMLDAQGNLSRNGSPRLVADATVAPAAPNPSSLPTRQAGGAVQGSGRVRGPAGP